MSSFDCSFGGGGVGDRCQKYPASLCQICTLSNGLPYSAGKSGFFYAGVDSKIIRVDWLTKPV
jgi:hypothetical protein